MRQVLAFAAVAAVAVLLAAPPAGASQTKGPTLKSLAAQIKGLQKQVTTLKKRVVADEDIISATLAYTVCSTAVTADVIQDTFTALDAKVTPAYFGPQTAVNDYQACSGFQIVRAHNQSPPNTNVMRALLDIFKPRSFAAHQSGVDLTSQLGHAFGQFLVLSSELRIRLQ
jgi:gas vesicle protein